VQTIIQRNVSVYEARTPIVVPHEGKQATKRSADVLVRSCDRRVDTAFPATFSVLRYADRVGLTGGRMSVEETTSVTTGHGTSP
jgi:hypothetical protein